MHGVFWVALFSHIVVLATAAMSPESNSNFRSVIALTATSALILMSPPVLAPSVVAIALGILVITRVNTRDLKSSTVVLVAAALLVFSRYAFIGVFSHGPTIDCTLQCVDEASGFLGFDETRWTWGTALVTLKMLFASLLVISLVFSSATFDALERRVFNASLLLIFGVIAKGAMHSALSFGMHGGRLGMSLSQTGYSAIVLLAVALGYLAYTLLMKLWRGHNFAIPRLSEVNA
jgi:hypothetical protein